ASAESAELSGSGAVLSKSASGCGAVLSERATFSGAELFKPAIRNAKLPGFRLPDAGLSRFGSAGPRAELPRCRARSTAESFQFGLSRRSGLAKPNLPGQKLWRCRLPRFERRGRELRRAKLLGSEFRRRQLWGQSRLRQSELCRRELRRAGLRFKLPGCELLV